MGKYYVTARRGADVAAIFSRFMASLRRLWRGDLPLSEAFWAWAVLGGLVVNGVTTIAALFLLWGGYAIGALMVGYLLPAPYNIAAVVGVWRSANRHPGKRNRGDLARIAAIVWIVLLSVL